VFPRTLLAVLDTAQAADVVAAAQRLEREAAPAAPERLRVLGLLLWTLAGLRPPQDANLMEFPLGFERRRELHALAAKWIAEPQVPVTAFGQPTGLSALFAAAAGEALQRLGEPAALRELAERARSTIDRSVHPESPLQGWRSVLQLLEQPRLRGSLADRDGRPLPPMLQLAAWEDLLRVSPPRQNVALWLPRFEELRRNHPSLPGMARVAAQLHLLAQTSEARSLATAWIAEAEGDPAAWLCRMHVLLRQGELDEALDDAMVAVQRSTARGEALASVVRVCEAAAADLEPGARDAVLAMAQRFRAVDAGAPASAEGGR
jgi:hypothetical protein